jgi:hypothetical protein
VKAVTEPNNRELNEKIYEIREWLVRIDTKMDYVSEVKRLAENADAKAELADAKAEKALSASVENEKDIEGIKKTNMWAVSIIVPSILTIVGILATVVF